MVSGAFVRDLASTPSLGSSVSVTRYGGELRRAKSSTWATWALSIKLTTEFTLVAGPLGRFIFCRTAASSRTEQRQRFRNNQRRLEVRSSTAPSLWCHRCSHGRVGRTEWLNSSLQSLATRVRKGNPMMEGILYGRTQGAAVNPGQTVRISDSPTDQYRHQLPAQGVCHLVIRLTIGKWMTVPGYRWCDQLRSVADCG